MKVSIVIPVYYNEDNLIPLYKDIKEKFIDANTEAFLTGYEIGDAKETR